MRQHRDPAIDPHTHGTWNQGGNTLRKWTLGQPSHLGLTRVSIGL